MIPAEQAAILMWAHPGKNDAHDDVALDIINPLRHGKSAGSVFQPNHNRDEYVASAITHRILLDVSDSFKNKKAIDPSNIRSTSTPKTPNAGSTSISR